MWEMEICLRDSSPVIRPIVLISGRTKYLISGRTKYSTGEELKNFFPEAVFWANWINTSQMILPPESSLQQSIHQKTAIWAVAPLREVSLYAHSTRTSTASIFLLGSKSGVSIF